MTTKRIAVPKEFALASERRDVGLSRAAGLGGAHSRQALNAADGTRQLLISGMWIVLIGLAAGLLTATVFGGVSRLGARSNAGWLALMVALMSTPFGLLLLTLGAAKWLRNFRLSRRP